MTADQVLNELKEKRLPTYGTAQERKDRLKKQYGIQPRRQTNGQSSNSALESLLSGDQKPAMNRRVTTTDKIDQIKLNRDARRQRMEEVRKMKSEREANNEL